MVLVLVELRLQTAGTMRSPCAALSTSLLLLLLLVWARSSVGCNKALCASDVSKCLIQVELPVLVFKFRSCPLGRPSDTN